MDDHTTVPMKRCTKCGEKFPATPEYFFRDRRLTDGLRHQCKMCNREFRHEYYQQNAERIREEKREYYWQNAERRREYNREYHRRNVEREREYRREYHQRPEVKSNIVIKASNYRARARSLRNDFTLEQRAFALEYWNGCCAYCGRQFHDLFGERKLSLDHFIPLSAEDCPGTTVTNMLPVCHGVDGCNNSKHDRDPGTWIRRRFGKRRARIILAKIMEYFEIVSIRQNDA